MLNRNSLYKAIHQGSVVGLWVEPLQAEPASHGLTLPLVLLQAALPQSSSRLISMELAVGGPDQALWPFGE